MVELAWGVGFASLYMGAALAGVRAFVVRLPFPELPANPFGGEKGPSAEAGMALAFEEMVDFIGQHLKVVWTAAARGWVGEEAGPPAPGVLFVGNSEEELGRRLRALFAHFGGPARPKGKVVILQTDHHPGEGAAARALAGKLDGATVEVLLVPVRALIEGGEEPIDAYTQKELTRLNFCPCCGSCGGDEGDAQAHSHGHHH
ncbi:unnamed protein product [Phytomonas sp. Hart1]|nr:unnamed protein product [Phytomonas sp. Hart1]|eukprot:CCW71661.1 unnamed protein product [Phytomonas sp. isolate Hart1]